MNTENLDNKIIKGKKIIENIKFKNNEIINNYLFYVEENAELILKNCEFNISNLSKCNVFYCTHSKLLIDNCIFKITDNNKKENNILFYLDDSTEFKIINSVVNYNCILPDSTIFYCKLGFIEINNTKIIKNQCIEFCNNIYNNKNFILKNIYSNISISDSSLINNIHQGSIFNNINLNYFLKLNYFEEIIVKDNKIIIDYNLKNNILKNICGFIIEDKKYIFISNFIDKNKIYFNLDINCDDLNDYTYKNILVDYLFSFDIYNSFLKENTNNSFLNEDNIIPKNYYLNIINSNIINKYKNYCNINVKNDKIEGMIFKNNGELNINKLKCNQILGDGSKLDNIGLRKYNNNYSLNNNKKLLGNNNINFSDECNNLGNNNFILGNKNNLDGDKNYVNGYNNIIKGYNNFILGSNLNVNNSNKIILGKYNDNVNINSILEIGNGLNNEERNTILRIDDHNINIDGNINCTSINIDDIYIENNNILGISNIDIENNLICDGKIIANEIIEGNNIKTNNFVYYRNILNIQDEISTVIKIDLNDLIVPYNKFGIIGNTNSKIININEKNNGLIFKCIIICLETPDYTHLNFLASNYNNLKKGDIIHNRSDYDSNKNINLFNSNNWKKGMKKEFNSFYDYELNNFNLYISKYNPIVENQNYKLNKGKFYIKFIGYLL